MKERVTLTIDNGILKQVDGRVDGYQIKNRSHAVELLLLQALGSNVPRKALILAAGKGKLKPINEEIPTAMLPIHNRPVMEHLLDLFRKFGITDILIGVSYKKEKIKEYFGDGKRFGVKITYLEQDEPKGTASLIKQAKPFIDGPFIVTNGDELKQIDIIDMFQFHKEKNAIVTIALTTIEDPSDYGVAQLKGNHILEFKEKPKENVSNKMINSGFYIFEKEIVDHINDSQFSLVRDVFPEIAKGGSLFGYPFDGQWYDTGNIEGYEKAIKMWKDI